MGREPTVRLSDAEFEAVARAAKNSGWSPEEWALHCVTFHAKRLDEDPLLRPAASARSGSAGGDLSDFKVRVGGRAS